MEDDDEFRDGGGTEPRLTRRETERIRQNLSELDEFRSTFEPEGFKGVSMFCHDCVEEHFYDWAMLRVTLEGLVENGRAAVHEPAYDPRPDEYIDWEYAQGYVDALSEGGFPREPAAALADGECLHCRSALADGAAPFCPFCGTPLAFARIAGGLLEQGWDRQAVARLFGAAGVPPCRP